MLDPSPIVSASDFRPAQPALQHRREVPGLREPCIVLKLLELGDPGLDGVQRRLKRTACQDLREEPTNSAAQLQRTLARCAGRVDRF